MVMNELGLRHTDGQVRESVLLVVHKAEKSRSGFWELGF